MDADAVEVGAEIGRSGVRVGVGRRDGGQVAACRIAAEDEARHLEAERSGCGGDPAGRGQRIIDGGGPGRFGGEAVIDRDGVEAGELRDFRNQAVVGFQIADDPAAAVVEDDGGAVARGIGRIACRVLDRVASIGRRVFGFVDRVTRSVGHVTGRVLHTARAKGAQEAHEAIRPTDLSRRPQDVARFLDKGGYLPLGLPLPRFRRFRKTMALFDDIVYRLIAPTMELNEPLRITCREDKLERLLADLAIQRLDLVISDSPMPSHLDIKGYSQKLGECGISFFATAELAARFGQDFPRSLHGAPLLIPGPETVVRSRLQRWFAEQQIQPQIVGEFDDSALMQAFGQSGSGIFIGPSVIAEEVKRQYGVQLIGQTDAVTESFYAISVERKVKHPGIVAITEGARRELFTAL